MITKISEKFGHFVTNQHLIGSSDSKILTFLGYDSSYRKSSESKELPIMIQSHVLSEKDPRQSTTVLSRYLIVTVVVMN